jgi:hypothetical protein
MDLITVLFDIILIIILIILKSYLLLWLANKKNWECNLLKNIMINLCWLLIMVGISIIFIIIGLPLFSAMNIDYLNEFLWFTTFNLIFFAINLVLGYFLISYFYKGSHIESFIISLILLIAEKAFIIVIQGLFILIFGINFIDGIYILSPY